MDGGRHRSGVTLARAPALVDDPSPLAYVHATIANLARDHHRAATRRPRETSWDDDVVVSDADEEKVIVRELLHQALRELSPQQRAVFALRYLEDYSIAETAQLLGLSEGTVKSHTNRATVALRRRLRIETTDSSTVSYEAGRA